MLKLCINQKKEQNRNLTEQMSFDENQQEVNPTEYIKKLNSENYNTHVVKNYYFPIPNFPVVTYEDLVSQSLNKDFLVHLQMLESLEIDGTIYPILSQGMK